MVFLQPVFRALAPRAQPNRYVQGLPWPPGVRAFLTGKGSTCQPREAEMVLSRRLRVLLRQGYALRLSARHVVRRSTPTGRLAFLPQRAASHSNAKRGALTGHTCVLELLARVIHAKSEAGGKTMEYTCSARFFEAQVPKIRASWRGMIFLLFNPGLLALLPPRRLGLDK